MMRYYLLLTAILTGCTPVPVPESAELAGIKRALSGVGVLAKQHDSTHAQLQDQSEKLERIIEKLEAVKAEPLPDCCDAKPVKLDDSRPKIWVTYADFNCPPCERLKADIAAGKFDEFNVIVEAAGTGLKTARPAIRFKWESSATGYAVLYEYGDNTLNWLRSNLLETTKGVAQTHTVISFPKPVVSRLSPIQGGDYDNTIEYPALQKSKSHSDLVSIHNRLHGGGSWTWPGDLATHLRTTHGYNAGTSRSPVQYRSRSTRRGCPTCPR